MARVYRAGTRPLLATFRYEFWRISDETKRITSASLAAVSGKAELVKATDDVDQIRCASGSIGIIREEVWMDAAGEVVRYNLAFIHHYLCRVRQWACWEHDNAHEVHERHWMGSVNQIAFQGYQNTIRYLHRRSCGSQGESMKLIIRVEDFEQMVARKKARAAKVSAREPVEPEMSIGFATISDLLECLSRERVRLCEFARQEPRSVTALAEALGRNRRAVTRDVQRLAELGLLRLRKQSNPGHGQVTMVESVADRFELRAEF